MNTSDCKQLVTALIARNVEFASGLTDREIARIEAVYGFCFPPDLRLLLQYALPVSEGFVNWRESSEGEIGWRVEEPFLGLMTAVEHGFWLRGWGERPDNLAATLCLAQTIMQKAPRLIPVYLHRYLPATPCLAGNPILSVWCSDIIYYGYDLADYFAKEFQMGYSPQKSSHLSDPNLPPFPKSGRRSQVPYAVQFWTAIIME